MVTRSRPKTKCTALALEIDRMGKGVVFTTVLILVQTPPGAEISNFVVRKVTRIKCLLTRQCS